MVPVLEPGLTTQSRSAAHDPGLGENVLRSALTREETAMTNPTTQEGEDFDTIVGLANPTQPKPQDSKPVPDEHPDLTPVKGTYPFDLPRPEAHNNTHNNTSKDPHTRK